MIRSCQIGGDPDKEAFLERDLDMKLVEAQEDGIKILSVTPFTISRAWSCKRKKYVSTQVFTIIMDIPECEKAFMLDEIKSEITELDGVYVVRDHAIYMEKDPKYTGLWYVRLKDVIDIFDKYKAESEVEE